MTELLPSRRRRDARTQRRYLDARPCIARPKQSTSFMYWALRNCVGIVTREYVFLWIPRRRAAGTIALCPDGVRDHRTSVADRLATSKDRTNDRNPDAADDRPRRPSRAGTPDRSRRRRWSLDRRRRGRLVTPYPRQRADRLCPASDGMTRRSCACSTNEPERVTPVNAESVFSLLLIAKLYGLGLLTLWLGSRRNPTRAKGRG